ncbi:hypothetical protein M8R19_22465 [Pseudomonas sp. R3.Fl]|uniref:hypothetical protein n=1 Tax=Pseudomonas TaxID=286 RepID=UPI00201D7824|nr:MULTISPECIES: hypothetical protein [Pseudomonas]MCL6691467.1 hypothetical protein [Pseudomonas sp. R3.Fl]MCP1602430.1 hypothetical protein [Pseudomonas citronellolis]MCP1652847.1 hypothetical protein [Pseudomonas citronellolis]MCP1719792.1 hypothetical protein [Pseudomonas citronellolis]MDN6871978.1 hypothetical protein [Pseudomonas citronellolis]
MTITLLPKPVSNLELLDAAYCRQVAARDLLRVLAGAQDLGSPAPEILANALSAVQLLVEDATRLYERATNR